MGTYKPIYHPLSKIFSTDLIGSINKIFLDDCGDHVIVINSAEIALPGDEWRKRVYFHHTGYPGGASWTLAWQLHNKDPVLVC